MNRKVGNNVTERISATFASDTAAKTGLSDRTIRHEVQIGSMPEAVRARAARRPGRTGSRDPRRWY